MKGRLSSQLTSVLTSVKKSRLPHKIVSNKKSSHVLINADCEEGMRAIPEGSIDLIITDPPYNFGLDYGNFNDRKGKGDYFSWLKRRLAYVPSMLSKRGSFYLIAPPEINARVFSYLEDDLGLYYRSWITWHYPSNLGHAPKNYTKSQRSILFFTKNKSDYIFNRDQLLQPYKNPKTPVVRKLLEKGSKGRAAYDVLRLQDLYELNKGVRDVWEIDLLKNGSPERMRNLGKKFEVFNDDAKLKKYDHPCQLPLGLLEVLVSVSSNRNSLVLDPFAGTFTTSAAADRLGRSSLGIELNSKFLNFGLKRLNAYGKILSQ